MYDGENGRKSTPSSVSQGAAAAANDNVLMGRPSNIATFVGRGSLHDPSVTSSTLHPHVDVRMIDFAHATHHGFLQDKTAHVGPDHGYLFGLKNLIHLFDNELYSSDPSQESAVTTDECCAAVL